MTIDTINFLRSLYGLAEGEADLFSYLWLLPGSKTISVSLADLPRMADLAAKYAPTKNVYFSPGVLTFALGPGRRPTERQISAIPGIWLDVDTLAPARSRPVLLTRSGPVSHLLCPA